MSNRKKKPITNYTGMASGVSLSENLMRSFGPKVITIDLTKELPVYIKQARLDIKIAGVVHSLNFNRT